MDMGLSAAPSIAPVPKDDRADAEPVTSPAPRLVLTPPLSIRTTKADRDRMQDLIDDHVRRGGGRLMFEHGKQRAYLTGQETAQTLADHAHGSPDEGRVRPEQYAELRDFLLNDASGPADTMVVVTVRAPTFENPLFSRIVVAAAFASVTGITVIMLSVVVLGLGETMRESSRSREVNNHGERE